MSNDIPPGLAASLAHELNRHGFALPYSLLRSVEPPLGSETPFALEVVEFPVAAQGRGTRIDFVLKHKDRPIFVLAECKRADPHRSNWAFVKAPYVRRGRDEEQFVLERARFHAGGGFMNSAGMSVGSRRLAGEHAFHVAFTLRAHSREDSEPAPTGNQRQAIEDAASQVMRGLNGMIEFVAREWPSMRPFESVLFVPVVFTTAGLFTSNVDLGGADLSVGTIDNTHVEVQAVDWLAYQYHQTPDVKHQKARGPSVSSLGEILDTDYIRTIFFVRAEYAAGFLQNLTEWVTA